MFEWMDEDVVDPDKPLFEETAKLYCRLCNQHKINYWEEHVNSHMHKMNKRWYKKTYLICYGLLSTAIAAAVTVVVVLVFL